MLSVELGAQVAKIIKTFSGREQEAFQPKIVDIPRIGSLLFLRAGLGDKYSFVVIGVDGRIGIAKKDDGSDLNFDDAIVADFVTDSILRKVEGSVGQQSSRQ